MCVLRVCHVCVTCVSRVCHVCVTCVSRVCHVCMLTKCVCVSGEEEEELHGKLEEDRFLFSVENDSAACDVLDLREVLSVFVKYG